MTEADTADNAVMLKRVNQVDIKNALNLRVEDDIPVGASLLVVGGHSIELQFTKGIAYGWGSTGSAHATVIRGRLVDLRRLCVSRVWHWGINLRRGRSHPVGRTADTTTAARTRRCRALRRLRAHPIGHRALRIRLLIGALRLLLLLLRGRVGRRYRRKARRSLGHLVLRAHLLLRRRPVLLMLLLLLLLLLLRRREPALVATRHDPAKKAIAWGDRWGRLLGRAGVLRGTGHCWLAGGALTTRGLCKLVSQDAELLFIPDGCTSQHTISSRGACQSWPAYFCFSVIWVCSIV